jgi:tetratricopeptide (TPR) repeat protein
MKESLYYTDLGNQFRINGNLSKAIFYYEYANTLSSNPAIDLNLGLLYKDLGHLDKSIICFETVCYCLPSKFLPRIYLMRCYFENNNYKKAKTVAVEIINMPVKVQSYTISSIKKEANSFLLKGNLCK